VTDLRDEIKELALQCATAEALELGLELRELKVNLSLELQAVRDQRVAEHREWREFMAEQRRELDRIKADFRTEATLLNLIKGQGRREGDSETRGTAEKRYSQQ